MLVIVSNPQKKSSDEDLDDEKPASPSIIEEVSETQDLKSEVNLPILTPISPQRSSPIRLTKLKIYKNLIK